MKTPQRLSIEFKGLVLDQDMHSKMIYVNQLQTGMMNNGGSINKSVTIFLTRKDTKVFIAELMEMDNIPKNMIITGRGETRRVHPLLAIKYATWVSKKFEILIYKFILAKYPDIRELGGDNYNRFRAEAIPLIDQSSNAKWLVINSNKYINKLLEKDIEWNNQTMKQYKAREFIIKYVTAKIISGSRPSRRIKKQQWLYDLLNEAYTMFTVMD